MPVWQDNVHVVQLFLDMDRQLNMGMGGPVGFRYESLYPLLDRVCEDRDEWWATFRDFQTMESAAMEEVHRK